MTISPTFLREKNLIDLYDQPMVFHCNHYNRFLQQVIEDADYIDYEKILIKSSAELVFEQLRKLYSQNGDISLSKKLNLATEMFNHCGFGLLDFSNSSENGGKIVSKISHYGMASKLNFGHRSNPAEFFDKGFIIGTFAAINGNLTGKYFSDDCLIKQSKSISLGDEICEYEINIDPSNIKNELTDFCEIPEIKLSNNVDSELIIDTVPNLPLYGDEEGLIPAFGVYLTKMYADYYNKISFRFEAEIKKETGSYDLAKEMLVEAGHVCAFNTFGGIMLSDEWKALIQPMLKSKEDWFHGILAVVNCLGWGIWRLEELIPNEKMVIRIYEGYESLGYLRWFGKADHPISYLATGGCAGLMNLLYHGDITTEPKLDKGYYYKLFKGENHFKGTQTKCLAQGDDYTEIVVTKNYLV